MLLERDTFVREILTAAEETRQGQGMTVAIGGEAGIGKTTLINCVAGELRSTSMRVLISGCEALFTPRPLGPLFDIHLAPEVDALLFGGTAEGERCAKERLFPAVLAAAGATPTVLVFEDVHWADYATLDLLRYLARRAARVPLLLLITYRDDEIATDHPLRALLGEATRTRRLILPRLSPEGVAALALEAGRSESGVYELTGGNPFYVSELLAGDGIGIPPTVRDAVLARAAKLSAEARSIIEHASVNPGKAERWLMEAALPAMSEAALVEATNSGIVSLSRDAFVFRHELGRRAIEDTLSVPRREALHATMLGVLQARGSVSPARLAHHAAEARDAAAICRLAPLAVEEAIRASAHREAATHYRSLLAHVGQLEDGERADILEKLAYECYLTMEPQEALAYRREALTIRRRLGERLREGDNLRWISRLLWYCGRTAEARETSDIAIRVLERLPQGPELAMAWSNRSQLHMAADQVAEAVEWGTRAIELAERIGDGEILANALNNVGSAEWLSGAEHGADRLDESLSISLAHEYVEQAARAYANIGSIAGRRLRYERAELALDEGIAYATEHDLDTWRTYMTAWRARVRLERGRWAEAAEDANSALSSSSGRDVSRVPALMVLGRIRARRGEPGAMELLDEARDLALATEEFQRIAPVAAARAEAAWLRGDQAGIIEEAQGAFAMSSSDPWQYGELALALRRAGVLNVVPRGIGEPYKAEMEGDFRLAAALWESYGRPWDVATALSQSDDPDDLRRALTILTELGGSVLADCITARLPQPRGPRASTRANPLGLTARELEILSLVSEGLRNTNIAGRLHLSVKTVDHHVSAILSKLSVRTRGEAAAIFLRMQTDAELTNAPET